MLDDILLEVRMLEYLVLGLREEEQQKKRHVDGVLLQKTHALRKDDVELHRLLGLILLLGRSRILMVHYKRTVLGVDVVRVSVAVDVNR